MKSIILTAGKNAEVYLSYLREAGVEIVGFLDDTPELQGTQVRGLPVLGTISMLPQVKEMYGVTDVYCPLGENEYRSEFLERARTLGYRTPNFIHREAKIAPDVDIPADAGIYILSGAMILPYVTMEKNIMVLNGATVGHHTTLKQGVLVSTSIVGAKMVIEEYVDVGMGSSIMTGVKTVGHHARIGAGAVVIRDVPPHATMVGVPARQLCRAEVVGRGRTMSDKV